MKGIAMSDKNIQKRIKNARQYAARNQDTLCIITIDENAVEAHYLSEAIQFQAGTPADQIAAPAIEWAKSVRERRGYEPKIKIRMLV